MLKLLNVDAAGERALRVVAYFDQLVANNADLEAAVRATAIIADCPAGLELRDRGLVVRYNTEGVRLSGAAAPSRTAPLAAEGREPGAVWIERDGPDRELDEFIVERFALTASAVLVRERPPSELEYATGFSDPALAQLLVNERASEAERSRAARLIGLHASSTVQLLALEPGPGDDLASLTASLRASWDRPLYVAELSRHLALAVVVTRQPVPWGETSFEGRAASGPVVELLDAPRSWAAARQTLRFAGAGSTWPAALHSEELGVIRLLGTIDPAAAAGDADVAQVERLASGPNGAESIVLLDHFLHADSLRSAAREVNFHHSSLQTRVTKIGATLGIDLKTPGGRERASLALLLWRLSRTA
jgi:hypothetical protein